MRATTILGPVTGRPYPGYETGRTWNGAPVVAFASDALAALVAAGDGTDANGEGLAVVDGIALDVTNGHAEPVETLREQIAGNVVTLYVPAGRVWEQAGPNSTVNGIGWDADNRCRACGEHIADPHSPECPTVAVASLREQADASDEAHAATLAAGGYTSGACATVTEGDEPAEVSHRFLALAQRVAADLIEMDQVEAVRLDAWPEAAEFVAHLTGEADQWRA